MHSEITKTLDQILNQTGSLALVLVSYKLIILNIIEISNKNMFLTKQLVFSESVQSKKNFVIKNNINTIHFFTSRVYKIFYHKFKILQIT